MRDLDYSVPDRVTLRLAKDARDLLSRAMHTLGSKNKNQIVNACLRESLKHYAGKRIQVKQSEFERRIFEKKGAQ